MSTELRSTDYLLSPEDYDKFRPGRSVDDILKDTRWRGNFEMATEHNGGSIAAISYLVSDESIWAIFVDGKFSKFVPWPEWNKMPQFKVGDFRLLLQALESAPLNIFELDKMKQGETGPPTQIDPGLTVAWLLVRKGVMAAHERDIKENVKLRDQFNASRLKLGLTVAEVESVLKAKPLKSGEVDAGSFKVYGSTETLDVMDALHYSNILVLFQEGKVTGIYSGATVPGGKSGLQQMREYFVDLP